MEKRSAKRFLMIFIICGLCGGLRFDAQAAPYAERIPDLELLPNAQFIVFYDKTVQ